MMMKIRFREMIMRKRWARLLLIGWLIGGFSLLLAEDWGSFRQRTREYYHHMYAPELQNFSCLFTTGAYLEYVQQQADSEGTYPLKFIWTNTGNIYYVLQPLPTVKDSLIREARMNEIRKVKKQFHGFFLDWQNFLIFTPFDDIPENARIDFTPDSIRVEYRSGEGAKVARVQKLFLPSGKLIKVSVEAGEQRVVNYPVYDELEGKWICTGWETRIIQNGEVVSGLITGLELQKLQEYWVPTRVNFVVQTREKPQEKFVSTIFLKDFQFNQPLKEIKQPTRSGH